MKMQSPILTMQLALLKELSANRLFTASCAYWAFWTPKRDLKQLKQTRNKHHRPPKKTLKNQKKVVIGVSDLF